VDFVSVRVITDDVTRLVGFYEEVTGVAAAWSTPEFAELAVGGATLAIASTRTVPLFAPGAARAGDNRSMLVEFLVDDVDALHARLRGVLPDIVTEPTTMPWGNRSLVLRDPDGNLVNCFTPITPQAVAKFAR
jgi:catechol 2,3-dioxygenase-like lactoylglutathione lyase family enzyme